MAKKRRLESVQDMQITGSCLTSLNDHCVLKIFEYLELNTLCEVVQTCKRFKRLVDMFFHKRFENKILSEVRIQVTFDGRFVLLPEEEYVTHFLKSMRNVTLCGGFERKPLDMVQFMRNNCNDNLRNIVFEQTRFHKLHGALLIDWLETVEGLEFIGCENLHQILRYCGNLKHLKVGQYSKDQSNEWMDQRYPTLEHLQYDIVLTKSKLITFLSNNPNVKSLVLKLDHTERSITRSYKTFMQQLVKINLEELSITFDNSNGLEMVKVQIQKICNGSQFKRLELCFNSNVRSYANFYYLKDFNHLHGLHILRYDTQFPFDLELEHLKVLQLAYVPNTSTVALSKNLPNLEELYLMFLSKNFQELVTPFARNAVKLKKIVARDFKIPNRMEMTNARLAQYFNDEREQLVNACKLFIYIGTDEFGESLDRTLPNFPLVQIRRVDLQYKKVSYAKPYVGNFEF